MMIRISKNVVLTVRRIKECARHFLCYRFVLLLLFLFFKLNKGAYYFNSKLKMALCFIKEHSLIKFRLKV